MKRCEVHTAKDKVDETGKYMSRCSRDGIVREDGTVRCDGCEEAFQRFEATVVKTESEKRQSRYGAENYPPDIDKPILERDTLLAAFGKYWNKKVNAGSVSGLDRFEEMAIVLFTEWLLREYTVCGF